jgi:hypothetical protein
MTNNNTLESATSHEEILTDETFDDLPVSEKTPLAYPHASLDDFLKEVYMPEPSAPADDLANLNSLLAESLAQVEESRQVRATRKALHENRQNLTVEQKQALRLQIALHELKHEWTAEAEVVSFRIQECSCCRSQSSIFEGFFQRQSHRSSKISRWVAQTNAPLDGSTLQREVKLEREEVPVCIACIQNLGYSL